MFTNNKVPIVLRTSLARRQFTTSRSCLLNRAIVYAKTGNPADVLEALTYPSLPPPQPNSVNIRYILSPINPADVNVIEGVYPSKPALTDSLVEGHRLDRQVFVGGNEAVAEVTAVGNGVEGVQKGDRVIMATQQAGTWSSARNVKPFDIIKVPPGVSDVSGATLMVNPPTAYNMLHDFADLKAGEWVIQNGANSAVGQAVIQIAAKKGLKTLNFVRNRDTFNDLKEYLMGLGATQVITYDELMGDKSLRDRVKQWSEGKPIRLMLNCVGGDVTTAAVRLLGSNAHLVSYGAMSKQPLSLPTSAFIFKNLTCHGFWQSRWYQQKSTIERETLMTKLAEMQLRNPEHEVLTIAASDSNAVATDKIRSTMAKLSKGQHGKKVLLKIEQPAD